MVIFLLSIMLMRMVVLNGQAAFFEMGFPFIDRNGVNFRRILKLSWIKCVHVTTEYNPTNPTSRNGTLRQPFDIW